MSDIQKKFYVLRAISGKENKVREYLEAELKNTDLGEYVSQVLIPSDERTRLLAWIRFGRSRFGWRSRSSIEKHS